MGPFVISTAEKTPKPARWIPYLQFVDGVTSYALDLRIGTFVVWKYIAQAKTNDDSAKYSAHVR
jgi:hypothetical protein